MAIGTGVYKVTGRNEIFVLDNNKWRYVCTEAVLFQSGYSWADVQTIPIEEWCPYEVGYPMPGGWADPNVYGYVPHKEWYVEACAVTPVFTCPQCGATFGSQGELNDHIATEHPPVYTCPQCGATFGSQGELNDHIATEHPINGNGVPASIPLFAWGWKPSSSEATMRSQYKTLKSIGLNSFLITATSTLNTWPDNPKTLTYYDRMFNVAAEMGIGIFFFTSMHRLKWKDPVYGQTVVERYRNHPALLGWMYADEPAARTPGTNYPYDYNKWAYDWIRARDPNHYIYASWTHDLYRNWRDQYIQSVHKSDTENWCKLGNVGSVNLYPWLGDGSGMPTMDFWLPYQVHNPHNDAFGDCGKGIIPTMEATLGWGMTDTGIVDQYNKWKDAFANHGGLKGICLYPASHFLFATGADAKNLRGQIKDLARLLGWQERADEVITPQTIIHSCAVTIRYQISSWTENNDSLSCPHCGLALEEAGIKGSEEIVDVPEVITPVIVTCSKCSSKLELSVSSFANKNIQQYCPVCGEPAD